LKLQQKFEAWAALIESKSTSLSMYFIMSTIFISYY